MARLLGEVTATYKALASLEQSLLGEARADECRFIIDRIHDLRQALEDKFDPQRLGSRAKLQKVSRNLVPFSRVRYQKRKREELRQKLLNELGPKLGHRIRNIWLVRAGLSSPKVPAQTLQEWITSFPLVETQHIGRTYIGCARDAMPECIKLLNRRSVADHVSSVVMSRGESVVTTICIGHVHDEAQMRVLSLARCSPESLEIRNGNMLRRGRYSKVQDHCCESVPGRLV